MNDQVEEVFEHMFAPNPIPDSVRNLYELTNKFASRIDALMRTANLAVIAGIAMALEGKSFPTKRAASNKLDFIDTAEVTEPPADVPIPAPEPAAKGKIATDSIRGEPSPAHGPTGPMDAPARPDKKRRAMSKTKMNKLTLPELREHARQVYGYRPKANERKKALLAILGSREPI